MTRFFIYSCLFLAGLSLQAEIKDFRLGVVDFQKALNGVDEGKQAKDELKKEFEKKQKDLEGRKTKLDKLQSEIEGLQKQAQSGLLKPEMMEKGRKLEGDFQKGLAEYTQLAQSHQKDIGEKEMKATQTILGKLREIAIGLSRTGNFTMVFESNESGLVYAAESTDITEKLIQTYNGRYKGKK